MSDHLNDGGPAVPMSDRPTPETDADFPSLKRMPNGTAVWVQIGRLRSLERQRDEALECKERIAQRAEAIRCELVEALKERELTRELARELVEVLEELRSFYVETTGLPPCAANAALAKAKEVLP